jgi:hypothetical protein
VSPADPSGTPSGYVHNFQFWFSAGESYASTALNTTNLQSMQRYDHRSLQARPERVAGENQTQEVADRERLMDGGRLFAGVALAESIENEFNPAGDSQFLEDSINVIPYGMLLYVQIQAGSRELLNGPSEIHEVPGIHDEVFHEPNVRALAKKVSDCLRNASREETPTRHEVMNTV